MPTRPTPARRLAYACAALLAAAGALAGASALPWYAADVPAPGRAPVHVVARGADLLPGLDAVALLALAGVAAVVALGGPVRRVLGALLLLAALWIGTALVVTVASPPDGAAIAALPTAPAGAAVSAAVTATAAPLLAAAGVLLLAATGAAVAVGEPRIARLGARYGRGEARRAPETDPDRAAWEALDAGRDPTAGP
ncbi:MAG: Trp biosynthesis-associated membrane protein [Pseudonocardia sp.]